jgi:hypothetical protein
MDVLALAAAAIADGRLDNHGRRTTYGEFIIEWRLFDRYLPPNGWCRLWVTETFQSVGMAYWEDPPW